MSSGRLRYLPLGGLGEVGINMWALEWEDKLLAIDAGLMFPQEDMLGIDLVLPDISYLLRKDREHWRRIGGSGVGRAAVGDAHDELSLEL